MAHVYIRRSLEIANGYLQGDIQPVRAAVRLAKIDIFGRWLAGEVLLNEMTRSQPHMVSTFLQSARSHYSNVMGQTKLDNGQGGYNAPSRARSGMRLAQLKVVHFLYGRNGLPTTPEIVKDAYKGLLTHAVNTVQVMDSRRGDREPSAIETRGAIGEMAVLLLAQRHAIRQAEYKRWLPLQSSFAEACGGNCVQRTDTFAWDMNIFTPSDGPGRPEKTNCLQIKYNNRGEDQKGPTLYISPDLAIKPKERTISDNIIIACAMERRGIGPPELSLELDQRTAQLLDVLNRSNAPS